MKTIKLIFTLGYLLAAFLYSQAQTYQSVTVPLDLGQLRSELKSAPMEFSAAAKSSPKTIVLPWYDGSLGEFFVEESPMLDPAFAAQRPDLRTYSVRSVSDQTLTGRITLSDYGLNAFLLAPQGPVVIHPEDLFLPFFHKVSLGEENPEAGGCATEPSAPAKGKKPAASSTGTEKSGQPNGTTRRTFRFAVVGTGEFMLGNGGTVQTAQTAVVNSLNAIQAIYDRDLAIRFTVLTPFIYQDPNTDPFTQGIDRTTAAAEAVNANFAQNTYDIGEVFHNSTAGTPPGGGLEGGGIAALNSVCSNAQAGTGFLKAAGWSGSFSNVGAGWVNLAAHEIGHQFGAEHTFNGTGDNCTAAISSTAAYEIASGTTVMSYQGICEAAQNIPGGGAANHYFHAYSISQMLAHVNGGGNCAQTTATNNTPPVVNANPCGGNYTIPKSTPFVLTGSGVDANGDAITYTWEQYNEDGNGTPTQGLIGAAAGANPNAPLFRSYPPSSSPTRYFPAVATVAAGANSDFEALPSVGRNMTFRLTGRDNNPNGGGMHCSDINVAVSATAGPFAVTAPNGGETWAAGGNVTVTWNNAGSTDFCNNVKISLSTDGGITYPFVLAASVANAAGTWTGQVPAGVTGSTTARAKVECADNACVVFYDISNANFSVTSGCQAASSAICPAAPVTLAQGAAGLNLGLNKGFGTPASAININVAAASPNCSVAVRDAAGTGCQDLQNQVPHHAVQFTVDKTGSYTFSTTTLQSAGFIVASLFQNAYNPAAPCPNFITSTSQVNAGGGIQGGFNMTATLMECNTYFMVVSGGFNPAVITGSVTFTGPGSVRVVNAVPPANFGYTYAATNAANGTIVAVNAQSDFTALAPGAYNVYGASHDANVNPATWVGQTVNAVYASGACALFSNNFKSVTVTGAGPCNIASAGVTDIQCSNNNTPNNPADDFFTFKLNPTGTNLSTNGYTVTGATVAPNSAPYGAATTFSRPAGTLGAGNAAITIQDNANQACQLALTVNSPAPALAVVNTANPATCNTNSGSAIIGGLANGQQYNIQYKLNGTAATAGPLAADANGQLTLPSLGAGAYTEVFAVPVAAGCVGGPLAFTLANAGAPAFTVAGTNPTTCGGADGNFTLSGLTANTVYSLSYTANGNAVAPADQTANANGQVTVGNLAAGNYTLINVSQNGCPGTPASVTLTNAAPPAYTIASTDPTTNGGTDGTITIGMTAASSTFAYTYQVGGQTWNGTSFSDANGNLTFTDLGAGAYTNIVITLNGCASAPMSVTLNNPPQNFFQDNDNDGFSDGTVVFAAVAPPNFKAAWELIDTLIDCNDLNPDEFPGQVWWQDLDGDGCGDGTFYIQCGQPAFCNAAHDMIVTTGDCNDLDPNNAPVNVPEICNGVDDDCDGQTDEDAQPGTFFRDADGDGFGSPTSSVVACPAPAGYVANYLDCNDNNPNINPNRPDICNGLDDNCNGLVDDFGDTYVGNVSFTTQAEVDAFLPCWARIEGKLTVQGSGISNLHALSNLQEVTGSVSIQYTSLTDLEGLDGLHTVGGFFTIKANNDGGKMRSLSGLENLEYVGRSLLVYYNFQLTDCCAVHELLNTPGAVGSEGGSASIFSNKSGCDSKAQVNEFCEDGQSVALPGTLSAPANGAPQAAFAPGQLAKIAPNPATEHVVVVFQTGFETGSLRLLDFNGKQLMESELEAGEAGRSLRLDSWNSGVYILQVQLDGKVESQRLVIVEERD